MADAHNTPTDYEYLERLTLELTDTDEELLRRIDDIQLISNVLAAANRSTAAKELFEETLPLICNSLGFDGAAAYLINRGRQVARMKYSLNPPFLFEQRFREVSVNKEPFNKSLVLGETFVAEDLDIYYPDVHDYTEISALIIIPIKSPCGVVGCITFYLVNTGGVSYRAKNFLPMVSAYIGDALRRIWAEELLKRERDKFAELSVQYECANEELRASNDELESYKNKLEASNSLLQTVIDRIPHPVIWKNVSGVYLGCNKEWERVLGAQRSEIIGKSNKDFFPQHITETFDKNDDEAYTYGKSEVTISYNSNNETRIGVFVKSVFYEPDGKVGGIICIIYPPDCPHEGGF